jgi:hypothetical protein
MGTVSHSELLKNDFSTVLVPKYGNVCARPFLRSPVQSFKSPKAGYLWYKHSYKKAKSVSEAHPKN